ncbi:hypothetical protein TNCV_1947041 [Trichonephila clavipes]|nr:hypothetical protein TNCV_1947041 [Trichonephila clavipes]
MQPPRVQKSLDIVSIVQKKFLKPVSIQTDAIIDLAPQVQTPCLNCGGGHRWCRHLSSLWGISPSKFMLSPVWCSRQTTGVLLALATMNFMGFDLTTSDRWISHNNGNVSFHQRRAIHGAVNVTAAIMNVADVESSMYQILETVYVLWWKTVCKQFNKL